MNRGSVAGCIVLIVFSIAWNSVGVAGQPVGAAADFQEEARSDNAGDTYQNKRGREMQEEIKEVAKQEWPRKEVQEKATELSGEADQFEYSHKDEEIRRSQNKSDVEDTEVQHDDSECDVQCRLFKNLREQMQNKPKIG
eukprot:gene16970-18681_t